MKKEFPVTMGDLMCPGGGPECELCITMTEKPDAEDTAKAWRMVAARLPFLDGKLVFRDGQLLLQTGDPVDLSEASVNVQTPERQDSVPGASADTSCGALSSSSADTFRGASSGASTNALPDFYSCPVARVFSRDSDIVLRFLHCVMDGRGALRVLKLLLHCYIRIHYGEDLSCEGMLRAEDPLLKEEYADPFARATEPRIPLRTLTIPEAFSIPEEDLDFTGDIKNYMLQIPKGPFMKYLSSAGQSPSSFLILMLCRAMDMVYPDHQRPFVIHSPADIRKLLSCEQTFQYCISSLWYAYDERIRKMSLDAQMTCFRGMLFRQTWPDYVLQETAKMKRQYEENIIRRRENRPLYVPWKTMPYMLTYVGNTDWGDMGKYAKPLAIVNTAPTALLCSVTEAEGMFLLSMELQTKTPAILDAFLLQLDAAGIRYVRKPTLHFPRHN